MIHYMNLHSQPFSMIKNGTKTIELRLLDKKRRKIEVGDTLIFTNTSNDAAKLCCEVKALHIFASFEELYKTLPLEKCGYLPCEISSASAEDMTAYYSKEKQRNFGVVGIEIELIEK